jgi:hypothetical protein
VEFLLVGPAAKAPARVENRHFAKSPEDAPPARWPETLLRCGKAG